MFDTGSMNDELNAMKIDVTRLLNKAGEQKLDAPEELGETVSEEQAQLHSLLAERPMASLASAFALGVVVGFMLRRHY
jgi:ElaB/YqjD/DUF883 family membrane-anchored ribosome-binding protein